MAAWVPINARWYHDPEPGSICRERRPQHPHPGKQDLLPGAKTRPCSEAWEFFTDDQIEFVQALVRRLLRPQRLDGLEKGCLPGGIPPEEDACRQSKTHGECYPIKADEHRPPGGTAHD
jgi:hypothetical protein